MINSSAIGNRETFLATLRLHNISYQLSVISSQLQEVFGLSEIALTDNSHCEAD